MSFCAFRVARWLAVSAILLVSGVVAAQPTQLRFGDITTDITNIAVLNAAQFSGTISWGPFPALNTGLLDAAPDGGNPAVLVVLGGSVPFVLPQPYEAPTGNWPYFSSNTALGPAGATGTYAVQLAAPLVYKEVDTSPWYSDDPMPLSMGSIDEDLVLKANAVVGNGLKRVKIEGQPFTVAIASATFNDATGFLLTVASVDYIHADEIALSSAARGSNDAYFANAVAPSNTAFIDKNGLAVQLESDGSETFVTGFPYFWLAGLAEFQLSYVANQMLANGSMTLQGLLTEFRQDACSGSPNDKQSVAYGPATLAIGQDGGLLGTVDNSGQSAKTYEFDAFSYGPLSADGTLYLPGFRIVGGTSTPAQYLLAGRVDSGVNAASLAVYGEEEYSIGDGHYAGYNLPRSELTGTNFSLVLACKNAPFTASDANKLYIRPGGVSGTMEASDASVAALPPLDLYNEYPTVLTKFNYTLLDNKQHADSQIDGVVSLPFPAGIDLAFEGLELEQCGAPGGARVAQPAKETLAYWNRDFNFSSLDFRPLADPQTVDCGGISTEVRTLWTTSTNTVPELTTVILLETNFAGNGDILQNSVLGEPSATLQGYDFTLRSIYYTRYGGGQALAGRTIVIGDMKLPFWGGTPVVALWDIGATPQVFDGRAYAATPPGDIDPDRNGFPAGVSSVDAYLNAPDRRPVVQGSFAGIIDLEYQVKYDNISRRFATVGGEEKGRDLVVVEVSSSVRGITREDTEILFGLSYNGLPVLNLSSIVGDIADPAVQALLSPLKNAMDDVNQSLSGSLADALRGPLKNLTRPAVAPLVTELRNIGQAVPQGQVNVNQLTAAVNNRIGSIEQEIRDAMNSPTAPVLAKIDEALTALETIADTVDSLETEQIGQILTALVEIAGGDSSGVETVFADLNTARDYIVNVLINEKLRPALIQLRNTIGAPGDLVNLPQIQDLIDGPQFNQAISQIQSKLNTFLSARASDSAKIRNLDVDEVNTFIVDTLLNTAFTQAINQVVAKLLEPLRQQAQNLLNGLFDTVNNQMKAYLDEIGGSLNNVTQQFNDVVGVKAAEMSGYAVFGGQSLDRLHIDAAFELSVPDDMGFRGALDMERFKNDSEGVICGTPAGAESIRITIAVFDLPIRVPRGKLVADIIELSLRLNSKLPPEPDDPLIFYLSDVAGRIETTGEINFEAVKILSPAFAAGVGENETFIAFRGSVVFNKVAMRGGIFLGRTCNAIEIISTIDPEIDGVITKDELTGIYAFGEASIPIVDYGCFLRVGATAGAGFWYFAEGPTYGGKLTAGVYGKGICIISVRGKLVLLGGKESGGFFFKGIGWLAGGIGFCEPEAWFTTDDVWADKWCATCVLYADALYRNGWSVETKADCGL